MKHAPVARRANGVEWQWEMGLPGRMALRTTRGMGPSSAVCLSGHLPGNPSAVDATGAWGVLCGAVSLCYVKQCAVSNRLGARQPAAAGVLKVAVTVETVALVRSPL